jgi:UDP-N-acetylglucosamine--N-acetylmuramyl-(pentapeptide) pyrophosphoryl-undecaprenol N-acetylglucosamine transferase
MSIVVLSAGGTGGHLFPAQALAAELLRRGRRIVVMTDSRGRNYASAFPGSTIETVPSASPANTNLAGQILAPFEIVRGVLVGLVKLLRLQPAAVVGFGGYPSLPVMIAAWLGGYPTAIHEQNAVLGRVNRLIAGRMRAVAASFPFARFAPRKSQRVVYTGNPVRPEVASLAHSRYEPPAPDGPIQLLVFGGSQGAHVLSELIPAAIALLPEAMQARLQIVQQCRPEDIDSVRAAYAKTKATTELASFFGDLPQRMARAHLIAGRSGASTVSELAAIGRPAILIPFPFATDDHQTANAAFLSEAGAAWLMQQRDLTAETLAQHLQAIFANPGELATRAEAAAKLGRPEAAARLADLVDSIGGGAS